MNVLITGAGGFIGSHLVDSQLKQGNEVRAVDLHLERLNHVGTNPCFEAIRGDITNDQFVESLVSNIDVIYHLASAHLDVSLSDEVYRRVNVGATKTLLEAAYKAGVKRFVHCSSVGVIGDVDNPPANESSVCHPTNIYERTKLEGETAALDFAQRTGFNVVVMRPAWVYGPRCPRTEKLLRMIRKGTFLFFGNGQNMRHPVYISDAVKGLELCAITENVSGEIFIIAGENPLPVSELIRTISEEAGTRPPMLHLPIPLGLLVGYVLELLFKPVGKQPPFSRRSVDFFLKHNAYDITKANRMLAYTPQVDVRSGVKMTIQMESKILREQK